MPIYLLFLGFTFISCHKDDVVENYNFVKQYFEIEIDTTIYGTTLCNKKFITLKSDGEFFCINASNFKFDSISSKKLNRKRCSAFYQMYDSIIVVENDKDYFIDSNLLIKLALLQTPDSCKTPS